MDNLLQEIKAEQVTKVKKPMILLVEDNADDEALALRALRKNDIGSQVFVVRDGVEALDFLFCTNSYADRDPHDMPQLTLLDIKLPKMNGLEVLRRIRANEQTRGLPIVLFSSSKEKQDLIEGYESGANSYVRKSVDFTQFVESIRQIGSYWLELNEAPPN